jgi:hypothetical protein
MLFVSRATQLKEYESLTLKAAQLREQLRAVEERREQLRVDLTEEKATTAVVADEPKEAPGATRPVSWDRLRPSESIRQVVELADERGQIRVGDVVKAFNLTPGGAAIRLSRAVREGWLIRASHGVYEKNLLRP